DYGKKAPVMYIGTEKTTIINFSAELKGDDLYYTVAEYKSQYYENSVPKEAPTVYYNNITEKDDLLEKLKKLLEEEQKIDLTTTYITKHDITERHEVLYKHNGLRFDIYL